MQKTGKKVSRVFGGMTSRKTVFKVVDPHGDSGLAQKIIAVAADEDRSSDFHPVIVEGANDANLDGPGANKSFRTNFVQVYQQMILKELQENTTGLVVLDKASPQGEVDKWRTFLCYPRNAQGLSEAAADAFSRLSLILKANPTFLTGGLPEGLGDAILANTNFKFRLKHTEENEIKAFASSLPRPDSLEAIEQIKQAVKELRSTWQPGAGKKPSLAQTYQLVAKAMGFKTWEALVAVADRDTTSALTTTDLATKTISIGGVQVTSFEELKSMDPRLIGLEHLLHDVVSKHGDKPYWCANYYWYGLIKPRLTKLVGWGRNSKPVDRSQMPRTEAGEMIAIKVSDFINSPPRENDDPLATSKAYEIAYSALEAMLPPCRHNQHGCPPYGDLANNARAFSDITILSFLVDCVFSPKTNAVEEQYHKTIIQLLHELDKHGECPSVVWPHKIYPGAKPAGNGAFKMLANINLLDHSLRVARLSAGKGLPKNLTKGEAIIAALAHDLGKIPIHRRNHQPQDVDHPWLSASVLGSFQDLYSIPSAKQGRAEYILDAVAGHHSPKENDLGTWIGSCDARARAAEMRTIKAETEKNFSMI